MTTSHLDDEKELNLKAEKLRMDGETLQEHLDEKIHSGEIELHDLLELQKEGVSLLQRYQNLLEVVEKLPDCKENREAVLDYRKIVSDIEGVMDQLQDMIVSCKISIGDSAN